MVRTRAQEIAEKMNARMGKNSVFTDEATAAWSIPRFSTGILSKDIATGGGLPFGRIILEVGQKGTAKTTSAFKAMASIVDYDHRTKLHRDFVSPDAFSPCVGMLIDAECATDSKWLASNGISTEDHLFSRPEVSTDAFDKVCDAVLNNDVDLIILDSLQACAPPEFIEHDMGKNHVGVAARRNNQFFTKLISCYGHLAQKGEVGPTVIVINQLRTNVGVMFGSDEVIPGGKGQEYYSSLICRNGAAPIKSDNSIADAYAECKGRVVRNKTYTPNKEYSYNICTTPNHPNYKLSEVMTNAKELFNNAITCGLIDISEKNTVRYGEHVTKTQKAMKELLSENKEVSRTLWREILYAMTGYQDGAYSVDDALASKTGKG